MPIQQFKSVYFPDLKHLSAGRASFKIAFGQEDAELHSVLRGAASLQIRGWLGHESFASLQDSARSDDRTVNAYCLLQLRRALNAKVQASASSEKSNGRKTGKLGTAERPPDLGLLATFKGGRDEPLHNWFPYLEGYSPQFVDDCLSRYAPDAARVLDPFGGVGTTVLTAARRGMQAFFCEVNPLLQHVFTAKRNALTMKLEIRQAMADRLDSLAITASRELRRSPQAADLRASHAESFGKSRFFSDEAFDLVLRCRRLLDRLMCEDAPLAVFVSMAAIASLVPASLLIRRGDLRFRTESELNEGTPSFDETFKERLIEIAYDLRQLEPAPCEIVQVCDDAKELLRVPSLGLDAVMTSPPYLNGTNYFRNTKIELWFMRCLKSQADLSQFRYRAITAGINDVTAGKLKIEVPPAAMETVKALRKDAYDRRIPEMAANYFADMDAVFSGLARHLKDGGHLMMDIGDSSYGGVHVPTERILREMLGSHGFITEQDVTLRQRASRDGTPLRQALLVFRKRQSGVAAIREDAVSRPWWSSNWKRFKKELPHQAGDFARRNWGHGRHSLCSYQGKMKPSLAHFLVKTFVPAGGSMLDPFGGVGTIPLEAALPGIRSISFDISPAALTIARAKLGLPMLKECLVVLDELADCLRKEEARKADMDEAAAVRFNGPLADYFSEKTFHEVLKARRFFMERPPRTDSESLVLACLLHILHGNRPYALSRRSHPITPFAPTGPAEYRPLLPRLQEKIVRTLDEPLPAEFAAGEVVEQDACGWWPQHVRDLDAIITSPPFFDSTRFYLANWMRLWFSGWEAADFKVKPLVFVDERQKSGFEIYEPMFRQARERMKPGGLLVMHLGKSRKCDMAAVLGHVARHWFRVADCFTESVEHCESHGIRDKGTVTSHQFLVLE